ncbi:MAG: excinuclease ABC subunit UvrB [Planctomycetes bacterium]|nr:excinuclease ABC subunit UvrB [Planctomycetota bacterium]
MNKSLLKRTHKPFELTTDLVPKGDQPNAIREIVERFRSGINQQVLMGVTGSGKTFTMANIIKELEVPALILSHNKTLAAQLYSEFRDFFQNNAVEYFVSYYDYYQPEAYIPQRDIYIEKDSSINDDIDRLRLAATSSLHSRDDVVIVSSVSCIYGLGDPEEYSHMICDLDVGNIYPRDGIVVRLIDMQYERGDFDFKRGRFRVRGDIIEIYPAYDEIAYRIELFGDEIERIFEIQPLTGATLAELQRIVIYPAKHFVMPEGTIARAVVTIRDELEDRYAALMAKKKLLEAERLRSRVLYDLEMLEQTGICSGIENYSRHFTGLPPGSRPHCLLDYFPEDYLVIVDESHVSIPQLRAMYAGDFSRKTTLVEHGFRLPSALDNRPMKFHEWDENVKKVLYVSATPAPFELERCGGLVTEQVIRPTGLVDPEVEIRPTKGQIPDLLNEVRIRAERGERVLVTTLTKRLAEEISDYFQNEKVKCAYLHSEVHTIDRVEILKDLRQGVTDVLVGINLLREGLDLPEVSLVAILDADKEGFLRSATSLIQTIGRSARHNAGKVIMYADKVTNAMEIAVGETRRRRKLQEDFNKKHGITPESIVKAIKGGISDEIAATKIVRGVIGKSDKEFASVETINELEIEMMKAAEDLDFEKAAALRDRIFDLTGHEAFPKPQQTAKQKYRKGKQRKRGK